ncbi:sulfatase family protein [Rhodopirellula sp. SWK7]|uniref:sulfatase family protein n=1 Tax=Rhodopirellula sp. SWK7 TaxID=595460 RepID=UPI0002BEF022|nr:arylsulfatase [Rhodopirellula sp. SWK7]EMI42253.1 arylsulfatase A [Rhodopirellula sp. SWK7]
MTILGTRYCLVGILCSFSLIVAFSRTSLAETGSPDHPNIVLILADDLGYGDIQCLNPDRGKIPTPHIDSLAQQGITFTDAHSTSSVCTPTRYSLLTGRYNWRTSLQRFVIYGYDPPMIEQGRMTLGSLLQTSGYQTAAIGKWHLGMSIPYTDERRVKGHNPPNVDWDARISDGPNERGFDYYFGISASLDMTPYIFIENDRFVGRGSVVKAFGVRRGPAEPDFEAVDVLPTIQNKTFEFIHKERDNQPFFAFVSLTSPHTPIVPSKEWKGKSGLGQYGDFVMQTDSVVGEITRAIDDTGQRENTLIIFTADNGCSKSARIPDLQAKGHYPSAQYRGSKGDLWDGGHRIPMIARWPAQIAKATTSDQLICQSDCLATFADIIGQELLDNAGEDSVSFLPALHGKPIESTRSGVIHHSIDGYFSYRQGKWKLLLARGSGGLTAPREHQVPEDSPIAQLYDMQADPGETKNLYESHPEVAKRLLDQLTLDIEKGRSTAGDPVPNDVDNIVLWKKPKKK